MRLKLTTSVALFLMFLLVAQTASLAVTNDMNTTMLTSETNGEDYLSVSARNGLAFNPSANIDYEIPELILDYDDEGNDYGNLLGYFYLYDDGEPGSQQLLYEGSFTLTETSDNCLWNTHSGSFNLTNFVELNSTVDGAMHHIEANVYEQDGTFIDSDWVDFCMENGSVCKVDSDGDGVFDNEDAFPDDASETMDSDGDGVGDNADEFPQDGSETMDSDMDGVGDNADAFPNDANETMDSDMDGIGDNADEFPQDGTETLDTDGDGTGDNADTDDDDDGVLDTDDEFPQDGSETLDTDGDGTGDNADTDDDDDGVTDVNDKCSNSLTWEGTEPADANGCTYYQRKLLDSDEDGVVDIDDTFPNDPNETADTDGDGLGDNADAFPNDASETMDSDMDGVGDNAEVTPDDGNETVDSDGNENGANNDMDKDDSSSVPGFTGILGTIALLSAAFIRRNE